MYLRVVRFTGVSADRVEKLLACIRGAGGPPGVPITGLPRVSVDECELPLELKV
jgi:hypothetical protein